MRRFRIRGEGSQHAELEPGVDSSNSFTFHQHYFVSFVLDNFYVEPVPCVYSEEMLFIGTTWSKIVPRLLDIKNVLAALNMFEN